MSERTLSIIKPDATSKNLIGRIVSRFEEEGLRVAGIRKVWLSNEEAQGFYAVHRERPFFNDLVAFMTSSISFPMTIIGHVWCIIASRG